MAQTPWSRYLGRHTALPLAFAALSLAGVVALALPAEAAAQEPPQAACEREVERIETAVAVLERRLEESRQHWSRGSTFRRFAGKRTAWEARQLASRIEAARQDPTCGPALRARLDAAGEALKGLSP